MKKFCMFVGLCAVALSALVWGHSGATGIVKQRMDLMDSLKQAMKVLKPIFRNKVVYDVVEVKNNALIIRDNAANHMTKLFPAGSLDHPSEAKPDIWQDWEGFEQLANDLQRLSQALHDGAENRQASVENTSIGAPSLMGVAKANHRGDLSKLTDEELAVMPAQDIFKMLAQNCSDCHKQFRIKKKH